MRPEAQIAAGGRRQREATRQHENAAPRHGRDSVATAPGIIPSIAARQTSFRVGSRAIW
jgi:hypothetical protein